MSKRNTIQLAIGYGLGVGMFFAGVLVIIGQLVLSFFDIDVGVVALAAVVAFGGVVIAAYNAFKLDRKSISDAQDPSGK